MVEIVAEISGNHGGDLGKALCMIVTAANAGCDYVKFQYYLPEDMPDRTEGNNAWMYQKLHVPKDWLSHLFNEAKYCGIGLFASVFSVRAAKEILEYDVEYLKLASPKSTQLDKQVYRDIEKVVPADVKIIWSRDTGIVWRNERVLYCPEGHPPVITEADFSVFYKGGYYGFSDHTKGVRTPRAFIRAGAEMIEKHFKLEGDNDCIDAAFSADPQTMKLLCKLAHNQ